MSCSRVRILVRIKNVIFSNKKFKKDKTPKNSPQFPPEFTKFPDIALKNLAQNNSWEREFPKALLSGYNAHLILRHCDLNIKSHKVIPLM